MKNTNNIAALKVELANAAPEFKPNGLQRTKIGTVTGQIIDIESVDVEGFKSYKKVYMVNDKGETFTLRLAGKDAVKELTGTETEFDIVVGIKDSSRYYIMSAK